jgi:hypothetical protein
VCTTGVPEDGNARLGGEAKIKNQKSKKKKKKKTRHIMQ